MENSSKEPQLKEIIQSLKSFNHTNINLQINETNIILIQQNEPNILLNQIRNIGIDNNFVELMLIRINEIFPIDLLLTSFYYRDVIILYYYLKKTYGLTEDKFGIDIVKAIPEIILFYTEQLEYLKQQFQIFSFHVLILLLYISLFDESNNNNNIITLDKHIRKIQIYIFNMQMFYNIIGISTNIDTGILSSILNNNDNFRKALEKLFENNPDDNDKTIIQLKNILFNTKKIQYNTESLGNNLDITSIKNIEQFIKFIYNSIIRNNNQIFDNDNQISSSQIYICTLIFCVNVNKQFDSFDKPDPQNLSSFFTQLAQNTGKEIGMLDRNLYLDNKMIDEYLKKFYNLFLVNDPNNNDIFQRFFNDGLSHVNTLNDKKTLDTNTNLYKTIISNSQSLIKHIEPTLFPKIIHDYITLVYNNLSSITPFVKYKQQNIRQQQSRMSLVTQFFSQSDKIYDNYELQHLYKENTHKKLIFIYYNIHIQIYMDLYFKIPTINDINEILPTEITKHNNRNIKIHQLEQKLHNIKQQQAPKQMTMNQKVGNSFQPLPTMNRTSNYRNYSGQYDPKVYAPVQLTMNNGQYPSGQNLSTRQKNALLNGAAVGPLKVGKLRNNNNNGKISITSKKNNNDKFIDNKNQDGTIIGAAVGGVAFFGLLLSMMVK